MNTTTLNASIECLLSRRSVSPKRLCAPGPTPDELELIVHAALRAPDHGALTPWRLILFPDDVRPALAALFENEKRRRDPLASDIDLQRAREHARNAPTMLAFVVSPMRAAHVPGHEQWLSAGGALAYVLVAAHVLGYGAIALSGERCHDSLLRRRLGLTGDETLAAFVSIGSIAKSPPPSDKPDLGQVLSVWSPTALEGFTGIATPQLA